MKDITIKTNNHKREFLYYSDLDDKMKKIVETDFDYLDENEIEYGWIIYKNDLIHISNFMNNSYREWHGRFSTGFWSAYLIKVYHDHYIIGYLTC